MSERREAGIPPNRERGIPPNREAGIPRNRERGPSGPARGDAGRSDRRGAEPGVDPSTTAESGER
jgi:hypothetical protein